MKKHRLPILLSLCSVLLFANASAQDLHFSQWFNSPLTTNPANTGFIPDADYRIGANYRNQWVNVMSVPYKTMSIWGDAQLFRDRLENGWVGVGGVLLRDVAGSGNLTSTKFYASLAYHQMMGYSSLLTFGINAGFANKKLDPSKLIFPDQFNKATGFFDAGIPSNVVFDRYSTTYTDIQAGMNYAFFPSENVYMNGGFSVQHLNRPRETFFETVTSGSGSKEFDNRLSPRYIGFVNGSFKMNDMVILNPMGYFTTQAKATETVIGASANYNLSGDGMTQVIGGLYYRFGDSFIPLLGFQWSNFKMSFSYDVTTSTLKNYNNSRGAIEFSLIKQGIYSSFNGNRRQSLCPKF